MTALTRRVALAAALLLLVACSSSQERYDPTALDPTSGTGNPEVRPAAEPEDPAPTATPGPPVTEAAARALLARRFRAAGWRVRSDVRITTPGTTSDGPRSDSGAIPIDVTIDGYDPEARIGFEYIDPSEAGSDLSPAERAALSRNSTHRILIVDPADASRVEEQATRFLDQHATP